MKRTLLSKISVPWIGQSQKKLNKKLQGLATLLKHVNNKFCKVNFKNLFVFFFALIFSCKLENINGGSEIKCQATRWGYYNLSSIIHRSVISEKVLVFCKWRRKFKICVSKSRFGDINQPYKSVFIGRIKSVINYLPRFSYYLLYYGNKMVNSSWVGSSTHWLSLRRITNKKKFQTKNFVYLPEFLNVKSVSSFANLQK